jgi:hypothetical protein
MFFISIVLFVNYWFSTFSTKGGGQSGEGVWAGCALALNSVGRRNTCKYDTHNPEMVTFLYLIIIKARI